MSAQSTVESVLATYASGSPLEIAAFVILAALLPVLMLTCSCFLRVTIVLGILRAGFGAQQVVPGAAVGLFSLILTVLVMAPIGEAVVKNVQSQRMLAVPDENNEFRFSRVEQTIRWCDTTFDPLHRFLALNVSDRERGAIADLLRTNPPAVSREKGERQWRTLIAAFLLSELRRGFVQGLLLLLPLLLVDISIAIAVAALGLNMLNPQSVAIPAKLTLFTLSDGWVRLFQSFFHAYQIPV